MADNPEGSPAGNLAEPGADVVAGQAQAADMVSDLDAVAAQDTDWAAVRSMVVLDADAVVGSDPALVAAAALVAGPMGTVRLDAELDWDLVPVAELDSDAVAAPVSD